jgi:hypothetical protein
VVLDAGITGGFEHVDCGLVDAFEKKELDLALVEGSLAHLRKPVSRKKWQGMDSLSWPHGATAPSQVGLRHVSAGAVC